MSKHRSTLFDGLLADNTVFSALMLISPVIVCADTMKNAMALIFAFSTVTFVSVIFASFVPKKLPYTVKIIIYALISSLVYISLKRMSDEYYPEASGRLGIYFPLIAVNSLIVFQTEAKFFRMKRTKMAVSLGFYILGFDAAMILIAFIRELFAYGTINSSIVDQNFIISGLGKPFGGFILLGLLCGLYRKCRTAIYNAADNVRSDENAHSN